MKMMKRRLTILGLLFAALMFISFAFITGTGKPVHAEVDANAFAFESGAYVKLADNGGLRFRLRIGATKKAAIDEGGDLVFYAGPAANIEESDDYDGMVAANKASKLTVDKGLIYAGKDGEGELDGYYYANLLLDINTLAAAYRTLDIKAVAKFGSDTAISVDRNLQGVSSAAALRGNYAAISGVYSWLGTDGYPIIATNETEYANLSTILSTNGDLYFYLDDVVDSEDLNGTYAHGDISSYTVTFDMDGGTLSDGVNNITNLVVDYGTSASALDAFIKTKTGFTFVKWQYNNGGWIDLPVDATVTGDITLKAVWDAILVYDDGIDITITGATKDFVLINEGVNAGKNYVQATWSGGRAGTFGISATSEVGLKASTDYRVTATVEVDGNFPAFYDTENGGNPGYFMVGAPGGDISFTVTTDASGAFNRSFNVYYNQGTYAKVTAISFMEDKGSIYGEGVAVNISGGPITGCSTKFWDDAVNDGANYGYSRTYATANGSANCGMSVELTGFEASTTYNVYLTIETDGPFPAFIGPGDCFIISTPSGNTNTVQITTNAQGYGAYSWNNIYAQNATYFDIVGVSVAEQAPTLYDATQLVSRVGGAVGDFSDWCALGASPDGNNNAYSWGAVGTTWVGVKFNLKLTANTSWLFVCFGTPDGNGSHINDCNGVFFYIGETSHCGTLANRSGGFDAECVGYDFSAGGEYLIEIGCLEAGHYYLKVNDTLVQEITNGEGGAGSYITITTWDEGTQIMTAN